MKTRHTFKPQLESLERRDVPSAAGIVLYLQVGPMQQEVQTMQSQATAAQNQFAQLGVDLKAYNANPTAANEATVRADYLKLGGQIQTVHALDTQLTAQLQNFQQEVFLVASDGDQGDQGLALYSYIQVNGGFGGLFGGSSSGSLSSQAATALNEVNAIGVAPTTPNGLPIAPIDPTPIP